MVSDLLAPECRELDLLEAEDVDAVAAGGGAGLMRRLARDVQMPESPCRKGEDVTPTPTKKGSKLYVLL